MPGEDGIYLIMGKVQYSLPKSSPLLQSCLTSQLTGGYVFMDAKRSPLHSMHHSFSRQPVFNVRLSILWAFVDMT